MLCHHLLQDGWTITVTWIIRVWLFMKSEFYFWNVCLYMLLKILVLIHDHASTRSPSIDHQWGFPFSILNHVHDHSQAWVGSTQEWLGCSQLQNHLLYLLLNILITPHFSSRKWNQNSMPSEYWQLIPQK